MGNPTLVLSMEIGSIYHFICGHCGKNVTGRGTLKTTVERSASNERKLREMEPEYREQCRNEMLNSICFVNSAVDKVNTQKRMDYEDINSINTLKSVMPGAFICPHCGAKQPWFPIPKRDLTPNHTLKKALLIGGFIGAALSAIVIAVFNAITHVAMTLPPAILSIALLIIGFISLIGKKLIKRWDEEDKRNRDALQKEVENTVMLTWIGRNGEELKA